jgi:hypothetical protein
MNRKTMLAEVDAKLKAAGLTGATAHYVVSTDRGEDDAIEVRIAGVATSVSIQVGRGYLCVNRYFYVDGELDGAEHLYDGRSISVAADRLVAALRGEG